MPVTFVANISTMFKEAEKLIDRYKLAKAAGFHYVECQFPYSFKAKEVRQSKIEANIKQTLINSFPGSDELLGYGVSSAEQFNKSIETTMRYAEALNCDRVHIMSGVKKEGASESEMEDLFVQNLQYAIGMLGLEKISCLLEPVCAQVKENYFLNSFDKAIRIIKKVNSPNLKLLLDVYHLQMMLGNLTNNIRLLFPHIGYVQISQAPYRGEPNSPGEIKYDYILRMLETMGYDGFVGLEYFPRGSTLEGLRWIREYGYDEPNIKIPKT